MIEIKDLQINKPGVNLPLPFLDANIIEFIYVAPLDVLNMPELLRHICKNGSYASALCDALELEMLQFTLDGQTHTFLRARPDDTVDGQYKVLMSRCK